MKLKKKLGKIVFILLLTRQLIHGSLYIANLPVGVMNKNFSGKPYLLASKQLDKTNNDTFARFINDQIIMDRCGNGMACITIID